MELRHLRYFCAVAEHKSFTLAARHLHVSQSAVSGQIRNLEEEIGVRLLQRNQRSVSLTSEGVIFLREARQILEHSQRATEMAVRAATGQLGSLSVGLCGPSTAPFLPGLVREFRKSHPDISLSVKELPPARQPEALADGEIDVCFTRAVPYAYRNLLAQKILFREPIISVLPKGHRLGGRRRISIRDISSERFVFYFREGAPELFDAITGMCARANFSPKIVGTPDQMHTVLALVEAGEGVALLPACVRFLQSNAVTFHQLIGGGQVECVAAWRRKQIDRVRDVFLALLNEHQRDLQDLVRTI